MVVSCVSDECFNLSANRGSAKNWTVGEDLQAEVGVCAVA